MLVPMGVWTLSMQTNLVALSQRVSHRRPAISPGCRMTTPSSLCGRTCAPMQLWMVVRTSQVRPAAFSPQSQAARLTESLTSNGARYCIGMRRRRRILRCACMRTIQTGGSTRSLARSLPPSSVLSSGRGCPASRGIAIWDSTRRTSAFVGLIHLRRTNRVHIC